MGDGSVSRAEFTNMFSTRYECTQAVSVTDGFEIAESKTVGKLEAGDILEVRGDSRTDEASGLIRVEGKCVGDSKKSGWVTLQGNQNKRFLKLISAFEGFCKELDGKLKESAQKAGKISAAARAKVNECSPKSAAPGPALLSARKELHGKINEIAETNNKLDQLKRQVQNVRRDFPKQEEKERNAHIVAREKKEAEEITSPVAAKIQTLETAVSALQEAAKPLLEVKSADAKSFADPLKVRDAVAKHSDTVNKAAEEARTTLKAQQECSRLC